MLDLDSVLQGYGFLQCYAWVIFNRGHATLEPDGWSVGPLVGLSVRWSITFLKRERFFAFLLLPTRLGRGWSAYDLV